MNAGELNEPVKALRFSEISAATYEWNPAYALWAKVKESDKINLFSRVGLGAKTAQFTVRKCPLTLHDAVLWRGQHYFITAIQEVERMYFEITTARVVLTPCRVWRSITVTDPLTKRTETLPPIVAFRFSGIITEKYLGHEQREPMAQVETTLVLVTPKGIRMETADLVEIDGEQYAVQLCHMLDEFKNEYEIYRWEDI